MCGFSDGNKPDEAEVHSARFHLNFCVFYGSTRKSASLVSRGGFASVSGEIRPQIISGNHVLVGSQSAAQALVFLFNAGSTKLVANRLVFRQLFGCRRQLSCEIGYSFLQFCDQLVCGIQSLLESGFFPLLYDMLFRSCDDHIKIIPVHRDLVANQSRFCLNFFNSPEVKLLFLDMLLCLIQL